MATTTKEIHELLTFLPDGINNFKTGGKKSHKTWQ